MDSMDQARNR